MAVELKTRSSGITVVADVRVTAVKHPQDDGVAWFEAEVTLGSDVFVVAHGTHFRASSDLSHWLEHLPEEPEIEGKPRLVMIDSVGVADHTAVNGVRVWQQLSEIKFGDPTTDVGFYAHVDTPFSV